MTVPPPADYCGVPPWRDLRLTLPSFAGRRASRVSARRCPAVAALSVPIAPPSGVELMSPPAPGLTWPAGLAATFAWARAWGWVFVTADCSAVVPGGLWAKAIAAKMPAIAKAKVFFMKVPLGVGSSLRRRESPPGRCKDFSSKVYRATYRHSSPRRMAQPSSIRARARMWRVQAFCGNTLLLPPKPGQMAPHQSGPSFGGGSSNKDNRQSNRTVLSSTPAAPLMSTGWQRLGNS